MKERIVPPIRTSLEYAPTDRNHLAALLGGFSCSRDIGCRIQNCFEDNHHLIFGADLEPDEIAAKSLAGFMQRGCRRKHQRVHVTWDRSEPLPLDGQEYRPAPWLVEDEQTGFDEDGNYHCSKEES